jgi:hypothetical protein
MTDLGDQRRRLRADSRRAEHQAGITRNQSRTA